MPPPPQNQRSILDAVGGLLRPSLQHRLVAEVIRRTRRSGPLGDPATFEERFLAANERTPRSIPGHFHESPLSTEHVQVREYLPTLATPTRTLIHLPGGAYTKPADPRQFAFVRKLADAIGARALVAMYDLAPEHTWQDSRAELVELVATLSSDAEHGAVLSGDSAGGGYALSVAQGVRDAGGALPERMVLLAPWVDLTADVPGRAEAAVHDPWLTLAHLHQYARWWAGSEEGRGHPEVSPGLGDLTGLPRTLVLCGTRDLLIAENRALAQRAAAAGWDLELVEAEGLIHVYPLLPVPEARAAFKQVVAFLAPDPELAAN